MTSADIPVRDPREKQHFVFHETVVRKTTIFIIGAFFKAFTVMEVKGLENRWQGEFALPNHVSNIDVFPITVMPRPLFSWESGII
jgi:1-acyl-sn-glycerol-3-phosphate acyltransferase